MSTKGAATTSKPHNYKAHFTRTRYQYEKVMERQRELEKHATDVMAKQQNLQDEVDFLLDAIMEIKAKAERGELHIRPASARRASAPSQPESEDTTQRSSRTGPVLPMATEYSDDDEADVTVQVAIEEDSWMDDAPTAPAAPAEMRAASPPKRPRLPTSQDDDGPMTEPFTDERPESPKRPRLS